MMMQRCLFVAGMVLLLAAPTIITAESFASVPLPSRYSHDAMGLEAEYQSFLKAFNKGQAPPYDKEFTALILPDPTGWFGRYFEMVQVRAVVDDYEAKITAWQKSEVTIMTKIWPPRSAFQGALQDTSAIRSRIPASSECLSA